MGSCESKERSNNEIKLIRPKYNQITSQENIDPKLNLILNKISKITKYYLISPLHILNKQKYEK